MMYKGDKECRSAVLWLLTVAFRKELTNDFSVRINVYEPKMNKYLVYISCMASYEGVSSGRKAV